MRERSARRAAPESGETPVLRFPSVKRLLHLREKRFQSLYIIKQLPPVPFLEPNNSHRAQKDN